MDNSRHDTSDRRIKTAKRRVVVTDHRLITAGTDDIITGLVPHRLQLGDTVSFLTGTGGTLPTGISAATIYYAIPIVDNLLQFKIADSLALAIAGSARDITAAGTAPNYVNLGMIATETQVLWTPNQNEDLVLKSMAVRCTDQVGTAGTAPAITITANAVTLVSARALPVVEGKISNFPVLETDIDSSFSQALPLTLLLSTGASNAATGTTPTNTRLIYDVLIEAHELNDVW